MIIVISIIIFLCSYFLSFSAVNYCVKKYYPFVDLFDRTQSGSLIAALFVCGFFSLTFSAVAKKIIEVYLL